MRARILVLLIGVILVSLPVTAQAQQLFDFFGQALLPGAVGQPLTMYSVVLDPAPGTTPIPLDFTNFQYTLVITDLILDADGNPQLYVNGTITIYEDAATAADYANPGTFTDGTAILIGNVTSLVRTTFTATLGSASGNVDWTGGSRLGDIAPPDQIAWPLLSATNSGTSQVEEGYDEAWDGKVEPEDPIVEKQDMTWGAFKNQY